jgi:hypothetical protein
MAHSGHQDHETTNKPITFMLNRLRKLYIHHHFLNECQI